MRVSDCGQQCTFLHALSAFLELPLSGDFPQNKIKTQRWIGMTQKPKSRSFGGLCLVLHGTVTRCPYVVSVYMASAKNFSERKQQNEIVAPWQKKKLRNVRNTNGTLCTPFSIMMMPLFDAICITSQSAHSHTHTHTHTHTRASPVCLRRI